MATTKKSQRNPNRLVEEMNNKRGSYTVSDILNNRSSTYTRKEFLKDLRQLRGQYKSRQKELENLNREVSVTLGLGDTPNEKLIQNTKLESSKFFQYRMDLKIDDNIKNKEALNLWNSLSSTMYASGNEDTSVLAGVGGIYHQQAKFLNMFLNDDEQIKTTKTYLSRNTNKGIRQDILNGYKKIQSKLEHPMDIRFIKDYWDAFDSFKERLSTKITIEYELNTDKSRKLLKDFTQAYMEAGLDKDKLNAAINQADVNSLDDIWKIKELITKSKEITQQNNKTQSEINDRIEKDKTSNVTIETEEQKRIKELQSRIDEQNRLIKEQEATMKRMVSRLKQLQSMIPSTESMIKEFDTGSVLSEKQPEIKKAKRQTTRRKKASKKQTDSEGWEFNW